MLKTSNKEKNLKVARRGTSKVAGEETDYMQRNKIKNDSKLITRNIME